MFETFNYYFGDICSLSRHWLTSGVHFFRFVNKSEKTRVLEANTKNLQSCVCDCAYRVCTAKARLLELALCLQTFSQNTTAFGIQGEFIV